MPYNQRTLASVVAEISSAMSDTANVHFSLNEIKYAVWEALRYFSACTCFWVDRGNCTVKSPFASPSSFAIPSYWYSLPTELSSLRPQTVTYDQLCREIQLHLYEPESGVSGTGNIQFDPLTVLQCLIRARNRFVLDSGLPLYNSIVSVPAGSGYYALPQNVAQLYRLVWSDNQPGQPAQRIRLQQTDPLTTAAFDRLTTNQDITRQIPRVYSKSESNPLSVQLDPPPSNPGTIDYIFSQTINSLAAFTTNTDTLQLPDDYAPAIKYAAISDLLITDSERTNTLLAKYCELRYQGIVDQAKLHRCVVAARVNNRRISVVTPTQLDVCTPYWMNTPSRFAPTFCAALFDLVAFAPIPTLTSTYSATLDVVRSAPIPINGNDPVQVPLELIPSIIDYAQHYLSLKLGGADFTQTFHAFNSFQSMMAHRMNIQGARVRPITEVMLASSLDQSYSPVESNTATNFSQLNEE